MARIKRCLNTIADILLIAVLSIIKIVATIAIAFCFIATPFIVTAVIYFYFPFIGENIIFEFTAIVMTILWFATVTYVFLPIFERLEDKLFEESAREIVAYRAMKCKAKLVKVDEAEDE